MPYKYRLIKNQSERDNTRYTLEELKDMGTFLLRDICVREKIMTRSAGLDPTRLDRDALIGLLYRYRGRSEDALADHFFEDGADILKTLTEKAFIAVEELEIPHKIEITKDIPLLAEQEIMVRHGFKGEHFLGVLADGDGQVMAVLEVVKNCLTLSPGRIWPGLQPGMYRDFQFVLLNADSSIRAIRAYNRQKCDMAESRGLVAARTRLPILSVTEAMESQEPLVIDFGASSTCASAEGRSGIMDVCFGKEGRLCPSAAAVEHCGGGQVLFRFGFDALGLIRRDGYGSSLSFLHNLKLYLFEETVVDVCDVDGNVASVSSDFILRSFFLYIIGLAKAEHKRRYTKLCFLIPEKRGRLALERLRAIMPDYQVEPMQSESVNSVYERIAGNIGDEAEDRVERELAFHCGGGSTSLTACAYSVENTKVAYIVRMKEQYLNGDSGFGGNNLTYLILQYLKIRILCELRGEKEPILDAPFFQSYSYVDEYGGTGEIYERFHRLYREAERLIPTGFGRLEESDLIKRQNFYRLWFLAENLKIKFFSDEGVDMIGLPDEFEELCAVNIIIPQGMEEYRLRFQIHKTQIELLLAPEIYRMVKELVEPLCDEDGILSGCRIRFTGMSCRIPVFRDALREFTVGRRARTGKGSQDSLKLRALQGAVVREQMQKKGRIISEIEKEAAQVSYTVKAETHEGGAMEIVSYGQAQSSVLGWLRRHIATKTVEFAVCNISGHMVRRREMHLDIEDFIITGYDLLFERYPFLSEIQGDIDSIGSEEMRLFVFRQENWDFCVLPVARKGGDLWTDEVRRFLFDDNSVDYFNGSF